MKPPDPGSTDHEPRRDFLHIVKASNSPTTNAYFSFDSDTNHTLQDDNNSNHSDSNELLLDIEYTPTHKQTDNKQRYYSLDDALKSLQFGRFDYILIFIVSVIYFSVAIQAKITKIIYCLIENHNFIFHIPNNAEFLLYIAFQSGGVLGIFLCALSDKFGRKRMIHYSCILLALFAILQIFSSNWSMLLLSRVLIGCCCYVSMVSSLVLLIEYVPNPNRFRVIYFVFCTGIVSYAIGSLIAYSVYSLSTSTKLNYMMNVNDWRIILCILSIPVWILPVLIYLFLPKSPHFVALQGDKEQVMEILKTIEWYNKYSFFNILEQQSLTVQSFDKIEKKSRGRIHALFTLKPYTKSSVVLCCISFAVWFIQSTLYETQQLFAAHFYNEHDDVTQQSSDVVENMRVSRSFGIELLVTACDIVTSIIVFIFFHFMDRKRLLRIGFGISTVLLCVVMMVMLLDEYVIQGEFWMVHLIGMVSSMSANMSNDCCGFVLQIYILEYYCTVIRTTSLAFIYYGIGSVALMLSFGATLWFDATWVIVMCYCLFGVVGFICCRWLDIETKNKPLEDHIRNVDPMHLNMPSNVQFDYVQMKSLS